MKVFEIAEGTPAFVISPGQIKTHMTRKDLSFADHEAASMPYRFANKGKAETEQYLAQLGMQEEELCTILDKLNRYSVFFAEGKSGQRYFLMVDDRFCDLVGEEAR